MSDPHDPMTPIHPQMPPSSSGGVIKKVGLAVAGLLLVVVITVVAVTHLEGSHTTHHAAASAPSSSSAVASAQGGDMADRPNGCAGGTDATNAISAAFSEPITTKGAVEFIATTMRGLWSSDVENAQLTSVGPRVAAPAIINHFTHVKAQFPTGTTTRFSTTNSSAWVKTFDSGQGLAQVYFSGQGSATTTSTATVDAVSIYALTVKDGHWFMASSRQSGIGANNAAFDTITSQITAHGTPVTGGC